MPWLITQVVSTFKALQIITLCCTDLPDILLSILWEYTQIEIVLPRTRIADHIIKYIYQNDNSYYSYSPLLKCSKQSNTVLMLSLSSLSLQSPPHRAW